MARPKACPQKVVPPKSGTTSLRLSQPAEAVAALLRERNRLLKRIAKAEQDLVREREQQRTLGQSLYDRMQPLVSERSNLMEEIHALFRELLVEGRLSRSARKKVTQVYRWLTQSGELEPLDPAPESAEHSTVDWDFDGDDKSEPPGPQSSPRVSSAKQAGGQPGNDTLRGLFRRLAMALHPDLVQQEHEQKRRTEVMKEVTRAYEEGNLARLLEIEKLWLSGGEVRGVQPDAAARCAELESTIRELQAQLKTTTGECRKLRKSSPLAQMFGSRHVSAAVQGQQLEALLAAASAELEPLRHIRDFVRSFSQRKISLADFLRGPVAPNDEQFDMAEAMLEFVVRDLGIDLDGVETPQPGRGRSRGQSKRRNFDFDDVPF